MATVYLLHFAQPLGNPTNPRALARHYVGWALNLDERINQHRRGDGCALTRAAVERGISFEVVQTWPGDYRLEKHIKALKAAPRLCPICGKRHRRGPLCMSFAQLPLPLDEGDDWPEVPAALFSRGPDWYELSYLRRAGRWQPYASALAAADTSDLDIPF